VKLSNMDYAKALLQYAGKEFSATVEFQWSCNPKKEKYVEDAEGNTQKLEGTTGCGARYYQNTIEKNEDGTYPERITCGGLEGQCGASLRAFAQLGSIG
jgi:hypothetical protein